MSEHDRITDRRTYKEFLNADALAHDVDRWRFFLSLKHPELHYQRVLRRCEYWATRKGIPSRLVYLASRVHLSRLSLVSGISVPPGVFGRGLSIAHYGSIVVNDGARIGKFCRIHSATNIGTAAGGTPTLGDFVYVGPGAVIYGAVVIGSRAVIGANAVVRSDVAASTTVGGVPAKQLSTADSQAVMPGWIGAQMAGTKS